MERKSVELLLFECKKYDDIIFSCLLFCSFNLPNKLIIFIMQVLNDFINFIYYNQKRQEIIIIIIKEKDEITIENLTEQQAFIDSIYTFLF